VHASGQTQRRARHSAGTRRLTRAALLGTAAAILVAAAVTASPVAAAKPTCRIGDRHTGAKFTTLQRAVDAARAGDVLTVKGTCVGIAAIGKSLSIFGQAEGGFGEPTLDGGGNGPVLSVGGSAFTCDHSVAVTLKGVTVTGGAVDDEHFPHDLGGGILNCGSIRLVDSHVTHNAAWEGGGILNFGRVTLTRSSVVGNHADRGEVGGVLGRGGGGVFNWASSRLDLFDSSISGNTSDGGDGGGVYLDIDTSVSLHGTSTIAGNAAAGGGGVFNSTGVTVGCLDASTIRGNTGGGIGGDTTVATLLGCTAGRNVFGNTPYDIAP
jgi:hypothetical protein